MVDAISLVNTCCRNAAVVMPPFHRVLATADMYATAF